MASSEPLRIGLIGLDTSHVVAFTQLLNDPANPHHIPGAKITCGFAGGSPEMELSRNRIEGYTAELRNKFGVEIMASPEAVAQAADLVFIMSIDGRQHLEQLERTIALKRPTFIDKPLATTSNDAAAMFALAEKAGVPLMSSSALRYADNLVGLLMDDSLGPIVGCDTFGPMTELPEPPGLFWYGIHTAEVLLTVMGPGWKKVQTAKTANADVVSVTWSDGRIATLRGLRNAHSQFGITIHREKGFQQANLSNNPRPLYAGMLDAILKNLPHGQSAIPREQTLQIVSLIEAANHSRAAGNG